MDTEALIAGLLLRGFKRYAGNRADDERILYLKGDVAVLFHKKGHRAVVGLDVNTESEAFTTIDNLLRDYLEDYHEQ